MKENGGERQDRAGALRDPAAELHQILETGRRQIGAIMTTSHPGTLPPAPIADPKRTGRG